MISKETVKPSLPLLSNPETYTLSLLDQIFRPIYTPILLVYPATAPIPHGGSRVDISGLKTALSRTLDQFYPLAGRFLDESTISCNHRGILFTENKINTHLSVILSSPHKQNMIAECYPSFDQLCVPITEQAPMAIQINVFLCGGIAIGCYMLHKLMDAASMGTFLEHWSSHASKRFKDLVGPDFEAIVKAFPPCPKAKEIVRPSLHNTIPVVKSFVIDSISLNKLRAMATSKLVPEPTRFEAVAAFIMEQLMSATTTADDNCKGRTVLSISVNMRPRMRPPLVRESMGNLVANTQVEAVHKSITFQDLVQNIHSALFEVNLEITTVLQGENGADAILSKLNSCCQGHLQKVYWISSWCRMGLNEVDFGFGKPAWVVPFDGRQPSPRLRNVIYLTEYHHPTSGDYGVEVWLHLEENEMQVLGSNPNFLAFASPNLYTI